MLNSVDARRRWFGLFFLIIAVGILIWGQTVFKEYLFKHPKIFVFYWATCFGFVGLAFLTALLDLLIVRKRGREERKALWRKTFTANTETGEDKQTSGPPGQKSER
jgi:hypothetical protein